MELVKPRLEVEAGPTFSILWDSTTRVLGAGPLDLSMSEPVCKGGPYKEIAWSIANRSDRPVNVRSVALVYEVRSEGGPLAMFRHGYQSWSPSTTAIFGVDIDPSVRANFELLQAVHHADQRRARHEELRSEWVTLLRDPGGFPVLVGFDNGSIHDGTLRLRRGAQGNPELWCEAFLGDALLEPGRELRLHSVLIDDRPQPSGEAKLAGFAAEVGARAKARIGADYQVGWCSWYQYFDSLSEQDVRANLALAGDWPFALFQIDDGYQAAVGDWLATNEKFPSSLDSLASSIAAAGFTPGLWIAPFLAAPGSEVCNRNWEWLARHRPGSAVPGATDRASGDEPLRVWWNPAWGRAENGFVYGLDTTHPEVLDHLENLARDLVDAGFGYLKLDFTFSPSADGIYHDPSMTPAQRVRAGYEAIRRGAGDAVFILGCGVPLSNVVGIVDANRIGPDVAPLWELPESAEIIPGYLEIQPSTKMAYAATAARAWMHRRLWCNDPDCVMLRDQDTALSFDQARTWARTVGLSGGMALVSDDLGIVGDAGRALFEETLSLGKEADARARQGEVALPTDLLEHRLPTGLHSTHRRLAVDPITGTSQLLELG